MRALLRISGYRQSLLARQASIILTTKIKICYMFFFSVLVMVGKLRRITDKNSVFAAVTTDLSKEYDCTTVFFSFRYEIASFCFCVEAKKNRGKINIYLFAEYCIRNFTRFSLHRKCPYSALFWSVFSHIWTRITPNMDVFHTVSILGQL